jgi:hypothetical protein
MILKCIRQNNGGKFGVWAQNKAKLCKNWIITLFFVKNADFVSGNCRKSAKSVIITLPPG